MSEGFTKHCIHNNLLLRVESSRKVIEHVGRAVSPDMRKSLAHRERYAKSRAPDAQGENSFEDVDLSVKPEIRVLLSESSAQHR